MAQENQDGKKYFNASNTEAARLYNENIAVLQLGYWNDGGNRDVGTIKISPAFEKPENNKVYNYDKEQSAFFVISNKDIPKIKKGITLLLAGQIDSFAIKHFGEKSKSVLAVGNNFEGYNVYLNIMELNEAGEITKDLLFNFVEDTDESTLLVNFDSESLDGTLVNINSSLEVFMNYIQALQRVNMKENQHLPIMFQDGNKSTSSNSPVINQKPKERRITTPGNRKVQTIDAAEAASKLFED